MTASTERSGKGLVSARGRAPDFFIVGNPKSGTTALYEMLRADRQIYMPELKEPWFLADDLRPRLATPRSPTLPQTLEQYLALFDVAEPEQLVGEATSTYLFSRRAPERIAQLRPDARIIAILREPASFLRSLHLELLRTHVETVKDLRRALSLEGPRREGRKIPHRSHRPQLLQYSEHVRYVEQLRRYHALFPAEQLLVLIYEDFRRDNVGTVRAVQRFLGVQEAAPVEVKVANPTLKRMRMPQLDELVNVVTVGRGPTGRAAKAVLKAVMPSEQLRAKALGATHRKLLYGAPPATDETLMLELRRRFEPEVVAVSEYLDRDLVSLWGYDGLA